ITGNAYTQKLPQVPETWDGAITSFEKSDQVARILNPELMLNFLSTKRQEASKMADLSPEQQIEIYLDSV
ncbi:MAG: glutamine synthetase, partial [Tateyamaria sp.]|nr:glutamine synthetase [Tateyamaria sp.]